MATKKTRQTKSVKAPAPVATTRTPTIKKAKPTVSLKPAPEITPGKPATRKLLILIWLLITLTMAGVVIAPYAKEVEWSELKLNLPTLPNITFFTTAPIPAPVVEKKVVEEPISRSRETEILKQQLADAANRIQQLQYVVQEKDKALQYEIALRGQSLLGQYARLIEHALEKGLPFPWELEQLKHFSDNNMPEATRLVQELTPYAQGVASMEKLKEDFRTLSDDIYVRWKKEDTATGFRAVFWRMMHQLISIRRVGMVEGNSPEAIVARAEFHLNKGDIPQAMLELAAFRGSYATIAAPWLEEAQLRLEALKLIQELHELAQKVTTGAALESEHPVLPVKIEDQ